jgi:hypothetical protein
MTNNDSAARNGLPGTQLLTILNTAHHVHEVQDVHEVNDVREIHDVHEIYAVPLWRYYS